MDIVNRIVREPAALIGFVTLVVASGSIFGWWNITTAQADWILAIVGASILLLRSYVTPVSDPNLPIGTIVNARSSSAPTGVVVEKVES